MMSKPIPSSIRRAAKVIVDKIRPPVCRCTRLLIDATKPYIARSSKALKTKLSLSNAQQLITRKVVQHVPATSQNIQDSEAVHEIRERFIPLTKKSIVQLLIKKEWFLTDEEKKIYEDFALALDSTLANQYHSVLQELKTLYDPINPDRDTTIHSLKFTARERQDNEFWLLRRLDDIAEKANFCKLPRSVIDKAFAPHNVHGVQNLRMPKIGFVHQHIFWGTKATPEVSIDTSKYDVLKFWVLGHEKIPEPTSWYRAFFMKIDHLPKTKTFYKRVILAARLKHDEKLMLKSFKDIPDQSLDMLLADRKIQIPNVTKAMINTCSGLSMAGVLVKFGTLYAGMTAAWPLIFSSATGVLSLIGAANYLNKRIQYQTGLSRLLYLKNITNNHGLLALLVDRAKDEFFKEALLIYTFLLTSQPRSLFGKQTTEMSPCDLGGITLKELQNNIEKWVWEVTGAHVSIQTSEALQLLQRFGLLGIDEDHFNVQALKVALCNLPQQPQSMIIRESESDLLEDCDGDGQLKTADDYIKTVNKQKRYGWF